MTLKDLCSLYHGQATFEVHRAIDGGLEDVITFESQDYDAVKDDILSEKIMRYSSELAHKMVVILEAKEEAAEVAPETTPETPAPSEGE